LGSKQDVKRQTKGVVLCTSWQFMMAPMSSPLPLLPGPSNNENQLLPNKHCLKNSKPLLIKALVCAPLLLTFLCPPSSSWAPHFVWHNHLPTSPQQSTNSYEKGLSYHTTLLASSVYKLCLYLSLTSVIALCNLSRELNYLFNLFFYLFIIMLALL